MNKEIKSYNNSLSGAEKEICDKLSEIIGEVLKESDSKVWHGHPVWFIDENPLVGYSKLKDGIRLLFWSGQSFEEDELKPEGKFKAAEIRYNDAADIKTKDLKRWLKKSRDIQWDYKNIVKRKGKLLRIKN